MTTSITSAAQRFRAGTLRRASSACWQLTKLCCVLACLLPAGCQSPHQDLELVRRSRPLLGTFVTITAYGEDRDALNAAISAAFEEFERVDALMSIHRADSELSRVNEMAALRPEPVSPDLFYVLEKALEISELSDGNFDVTIRPLADLWGFIWKRDYRFPTQAELDSVLPRVNFRLIELDPAARTVHFRSPGISIDLGGIAKGYAVDRAIERMQAMGVRHAMVKAGGDLRVIGAPPGQSAWTVQLEDPRKEGNRQTVTLRDAALSTSGDYENFFEYEGRRYSHILNPRTGYPVEGVVACTVIAPTCIESDAWATTCMILGPEASERKVGSRYSVRFTTSPPG